MECTWLLGSFCHIKFTGLSPGRCVIVMLEEPSMSNDNRDFNNAEHRRAYIRECSRVIARAEKAASPLASLTDRGIDLTPDEEPEVRAFAARLNVNYDEVAIDIASRNIVIGDRSNTKLLRSMGKCRAIPRNELALLMKDAIYFEACQAGNS